jgi:DNA-binding LacI/PurR family transcriptional regulator
MTDKPRVRNIADLARIAGVSPGTVSRALSGAGLISQSTRDRIQELAREHDFRPNLMARNLRIRRTGAIGVAALLGASNGAADAAHTVAALGRIADALEDRGYVLVLTRLTEGDNRSLAAFVESGRVDGVIVIDGNGGAAGEAGGVPVMDWQDGDAGRQVDDLLARVNAPKA